MKCVLKVLRVDEDSKKKKKVILNVITGVGSSE